MYCNMSCFWVREQRWGDSATPPLVSVCLLFIIWSGEVANWGGGGGGIMIGPLGKAIRCSLCPYYVIIVTI